MPRTFVPHAGALAGWAAAGLVLLLAGPPAVHAQVAGELHGHITQPGGAPASGAKLRVSDEAGHSAEARTDPGGSYRVRLPSAADRFVVSVEAAGSTPVTRVVMRPVKDGDISFDLTLELRVVRLEPLRVRVPRLTVASATRGIPGTVEQSRLGVTLKGEPLEGDGLAELTSRQTGVAVSGTGISIAGQGPDQTRLTLDGATADGAVIPREALQSINVLTNTFDVSRGQFTGGQVDVRTLQGGNDWGAALRVDAAGRRFQYGDAVPDLRRRADRLALDAGAGGALIRARLFIFGAVTATRTASAPPTLQTLTPDEVRRLQLSPGAVARFLSFTESLQLGGGRQSDPAATAASGLVRLDGVLSPRHSVMLRLSGQSSRDPQYRSPLSTVGGGDVLRRSSAAFLAQLNSGGRLVANHLQIQGSGSWRRSPAAELPAGAVAVGTEGADSVDTSTLLWFAGNAFPGQSFRQHLLELDDQAVVVTPDRRHRIRLGVEAATQHVRSLGLPSPGSFMFESLADLEGGRPALFTRSFGGTQASAGEQRWAAFADDRWRLGKLQLSYGVRADRWSYTRDREAAADILARFGRGSGELPPQFEVSPRIGFSTTVRMPWDRGAGAKTGIDGGIGRFVGSLPLSQVAAAFSDDGTPGAAALVCIGSAAPVPEWEKYRSDPNAVPESCADAASPGASRLPGATVFSPAFRVPSAWRASVSGQGVGPGGVLWRLTALALRGTNRSAAFDRNLTPSPAFLNGAEGGRAVYSPASEIDTATGLIPVAASRQAPEFGTIREITSDGRSRSFQLSASLSRSYGTIAPQIGYTWTHARETSGPLSAIGAPGASVGEAGPRLEWTPSPYTPRHMLYAAADWRRSPAFSLGLVGRFSSGTLFTPMVRGDVNGDGSANDRAYVFASGEDAGDAGAGMTSLLRTTPGGVRECLSRQTGRVAANNSCSTGAFLTVDLRARVAFGPRIGSSPYRRISVWLLARNVTSGLDYLVHGADGLRNWGQPGSVDNILLTVRGFDRESRQFSYDVNPRFGSPAALASLQRFPFTLSIQGRIVVGSDRVQAAFERAMEARSNRTEAFTRENLRAHFADQLPNIAAKTLELNGPLDLRLTPSQAERLQYVADSVGERLTRAIEALTDTVAKSAGAAAAQVLGEHLRSLVSEAVALRRSQIEALRATLTQEQWRKLPSYLRVASNTFMPYPAEEITAPAEY